VLDHEEGDLADALLEVQVKEVDATIEGAEVCQDAGGVGAAAHL
jgi:hypothetical protein